MNRKAAITVNRSREEVERLWRDPEYAPEYLRDGHAAIAFADAPGDRGTEIHVELPANGDGPAAKAVDRIAGAASLARAKDGLRRFKQVVETGEISRSDATPEGERVGRKLKQRPAQPLPEAELQKAGA